LGFRFVFPKGTNPQGKPIGRPFTVVKAKNKNILEITRPVPLSPEHIKKLESISIFEFFNNGKYINAKDITHTTEKMFYVKKDKYPDIANNQE